MKKVKKIALICLTIIFSVCCLAMVGLGCKSDDGVNTTPPPSTEASLKLNVNACELVVHETIKLNAATDSQAPVAWSSENPEIVSVSSDGTVTALRVGETYVVATAGEDEAKCFVRVLASGQVAVIKIGGIMGDTLNIYKGSAFEPELSAYFDGNELENVEFTVTAKKSGVVSVAGYVINALEIGSCELEVTAKSNGIELTGAKRVITVNVIERSYLALSEASLKLYAVQTLGTDNYETSKTVTAKLFINGQETSTTGISWQSSDTAVADVDQNGKITAKSVGSARITAQCQGVTSAVDVTVAYAVKDVEGEILVDNRKLDELKTLDVFGDGSQIKEVYDVTNETDVSKLQPIDLTKKAITGDRTLLICNDKYGVRTAAKVGDYVVYDSADLVNVVKTATKGYIILGADIVDAFSFERDSASRIEFSGTFDGNYHTINSMTISGQHNGLFYKIREAVTIKNLYVRKSVLGDSVTGTFASQVNLGSLTLDNVSVGEVVFNDGAVYQGAVAANFESGAIIVKDSLIIANVTNENKHGALSGKNNVGYATIDNSYFITNGKLVSGYATGNGNAIITNEKALPYQTLQPIVSEIPGVGALTLQISELAGQVNKVYLGETPVDFTQSGANIGIPVEQIKGNSKLVLCASASAYVADFSIKYTQLTPVLKDGSVAGALELDASAIQSEIVRVNINGADVEGFTVDGATLVIPENVKAQIGEGDHDVVIFAKAKTYELTLTLATIIDDATEMTELFGATVTHENKYFILNADLTNFGGANSSVSGYKSWRAAATLKNCIFDGRGHTVSGTMFSLGLFRRIQATTVRNLVFDNVGLTLAEYGGIVALDTHSGSVIENVAINVTALNKPANGVYKQGGGVIGLILNSTLTLKDVLVSFDGEAGNEYIGAAVGRHNVGAGDVIMNNSYFVSANLSLCAETTGLTAGSYSTERLDALETNRLFKTAASLKDYVQTNGVQLSSNQLSMLNK